MNHLIIGTAGHVDHGKTSLIKTLTNIDCDTHREEKERGITINLGFSHLELPNGDSLGIVDVPGHKDFINTMVGGACGIDMVLLVVAADSGIMPQTIEHINIITALGISKGVVALTKIDLVDEELAEIASFEISNYLEKSTLKGAPVVGVSSTTGKGIEELVNSIAIVASQVEPKKVGNLFRMYIDRIFTVKGFGSVVTGSVSGGKIGVGNELYLLPGSFPKLRVRSLERHGKQVESVVAGDRAAVNLIGIKNEDFSRGMMIADKQLSETLMPDAAVSFFDADYPIPIWSSITFISGTFESQARMHLLSDYTPGANQDALVQIHLNKPAVLMVRDKFIIRNTSCTMTLGGGHVIDASPLHHRKRTPKLIEYLTELNNSIMGEQSLMQIVGIELKKEPRPFLPEEIAHRLSVGADELREEILMGNPYFRLYRSAEQDIYIDDLHDKSYSHRIIKIIKDYHSKNPVLATGLDTREIGGKLGLMAHKAGKPYLELLLAGMRDDGLVEEVQGTWIVKAHKPRLDQKTMDDINRLENEILSYGDEKPVLSEIEQRAEENRIPKAKVKQYLSYLASEGKIVFHHNDFIHSVVIGSFRPLLLKKLCDSDGAISYSEYKELVGGTKRFRSLLLDIFEAEKIVTLQKGTETDSKLILTQHGKELARKFHI
ncbi:MAG TPA: selenocysteine-specific translation elongation factor [Tenuifilaceae bacterium]|nr:selenocysteine-specific translation elongation factor [Tenuifilaceae bacterium]